MIMKQKHSLLKRQLKKYFGASFHIPREWEGFIEAIDDAYREFDTDRAMLERSLDLSSQELFQANSEMRAILQAIPDLMFRFDYDGTILDYKAADATDFYLPSEKLIGKRIQDVPPEHAGRKFYEALKQIKESKSTASIEYSLLIDGNEQFYEARLLPLLDNQIIAIVRNITARKRSEEEFLKTSNLESIGILAGGIAHDFNNLLQGVFGYISMAKLTFDQKEKSLAMLTQAEKALHQSINLASQLLTFAKGGKPVKKVFALRPFIENAAAFALSGSSINYEIVIDQNLRTVEADEGQIGQVIHNIVLNAEQAMPLGGMIRVSARNMRAAEVIPPTDLQGDLVEISIRDQGTGILPENLTRIFDPYFSTKAQGSGLGLATSYSIIKNHGGLVRVQSEVGKGTTFFIYLLASRAEVEEPRNPASPAATRKGKILVMDDEAVIRAVAGELLTILGHDVAFAETGESALAVYRAAREAGRPFDVVILDLTIRGGMGGLETLRKLVEIDPDVKAVVSSGYSDDAAIADYMSQGFKASLKKPYDVKALRNMLNKMLSS
jgi:two-component system cell cycle sensor histidine kinase/response regulator CckA